MIKPLSNLFGRVSKNSFFEDFSKVCASGLMVEYGLAKAEIRVRFPAGACYGTTSIVGRAIFVVYVSGVSSRSNTHQHG